MGAICALPCLGQLGYGFAVTLTCRIEYNHVHVLCVYGVIRGCTNDAENPTIFPRGATISYKHSYRCTREGAKQMGDQEGDKF